MEVLLVDPLVPEALAWLQERHDVTLLPTWPTIPALRRQVYKTRALVLPPHVVVSREFLDFAPLLKVVARMQISSDNTDLEACAQRQSGGAGAQRHRALQRRVPALRPADALPPRHGERLAGSQAGPGAHGARAVPAAPWGCWDWRRWHTRWRPCSRVWVCAWWVTTRPCTTPRRSGQAGRRIHPRQRVAGALRRGVAADGLRLPLQGLDQRTVAQPLQTRPAVGGASAAVPCSTPRRWRWRSPTGASTPACSTAPPAVRRPGHTAVQHTQPAPHAAAGIAHPRGQAARQLVRGAPHP
jgi:hypothetical protein